MYIKCILSDNKNNVEGLLNVPTASVVHRQWFYISMFVTRFTWFAVGGVLWQILNKYINLNLYNDLLLYLYKFLVNLRPRLGNVRKKWYMHAKVSITKAAKYVI